MQVKPNSPKVVPKHSLGVDEPQQMQPTHGTHFSSKPQQESDATLIIFHVLPNTTHLNLCFPVFEELEIKHLICIHLR
jgi:hypothetical protein